ncbi:hypothetical protein PspLS_08701 [Pyricularia sp. CBS 133598]|nr:hypothetical protein PspLS_08701 [Pyricularia sp. CBS 133598]
MDGPEMEAGEASKDLVERASNEPNSQALSQNGTGFIEVDGPVAFAIEAPEYQPENDRDTKSDSLLESDSEPASQEHHQEGHCKVIQNEIQQEPDDEYMMALRVMKADVSPIPTTRLIRNYESGRGEDIANSRDAVAKVETLLILCASALKVMSGGGVATAPQARRAGDEWEAHFDGFEANVVGVWGEKSE